GVGSGAPIVIERMLGQVLHLEEHIVGREIVTCEIHSRGVALDLNGGGAHLVMLTSLVFTLVPLDSNVASGSCSAVPPTSSSQFLKLIDLRSLRKNGPSHMMA